MALVVRPTRRGEELYPQVLPRASASPTRLGTQPERQTNLAERSSGKSPQKLGPEPILTSRRTEACKAGGYGDASESPWPRKSVWSVDHTGSAATGRGRPDAGVSNQGLVRRLADVNVPETIEGYELRLACDELGHGRRVPGLT